jgi:hypothetical protein
MRTFKGGNPGRLFEPVVSTFEKGLFRQLPLFRL